MKRYLLLLTIVLSLLATNVFSQTVYITKTGTKYHKEDCRYLSKSKISIDLKDVISKGYGACKVCKPPTKVNTDTSKESKSTTTSVKKEKTSTTKKVTKSYSRRCSATTKSGTRCKRMTKSSNGKCWQHGGN